MPHPPGQLSGLRARHSLPQPPYILPFRKSLALHYLSFPQAGQLRLKRVQLECIVRTDQLLGLHPVDRSSRYWPCPRGFRSGAAKTMTVGHPTVWKISLIVSGLNSP